MTPYEPPAYASGSAGKLFSGSQTPRRGGGDIPAVLGTSGGCVFCILLQQTSLHWRKITVFIMENHLPNFQTIKSWEIADWIWSFSLRRDSGNQNAVHCRSMFWLHCQFGHCQLGLCEHKRVDSITGTATLLFRVWQPSRLRSSGMIWVCRTKV